ncbi:hypothetical protein V8G54_025796, partial [Vigna mungo]
MSSMLSTKRFKFLMGGINRTKGIAEKPTAKNRDDIVLRFFFEFCYSLHSHRNNINGNKAKVENFYHKQKKGIQISEIYVEKERRKRDQRFEKFKKEKVCNCSE